MIAVNANIDIFHTAFVLYVLLFIYLFIYYFRGDQRRVV